MEPTGGAVAGAGFDPDTPAAQRRTVLAVLAVAVLGISSSAVIVRGMDARPLAIAAWRTLGAALLLSPALRGALGRIGRRDLLAIALSGVALGLHFTAWFASLQLTTVLRSTVLVCSVPLWTGLLGWATFGERPPGRFWLGLVLALPGLALMAGDGGRASWTGDALALLGAVLWAVYLLIGRSVRQRVGTAPYMGLVCAAAAALLFPLALLLEVPLAGWTGTTWALLVAAVLGPQLVGHQGFGYAVRWLPAATVSAVMLLEPVGAALLAAAILGEVPGPRAVLGGALALGGVLTATWQR